MLIRSTQHSFSSPSFHGISMHVDRSVARSWLRPHLCCHINVQIDLPELFSPFPLEQVHRPWGSHYLPPQLKSVQRVALVDQFPGRHLHQTHAWVPPYGQDNAGRNIHLPRLQVKLSSIELGVEAEEGSPTHRQFEKIKGGGHVCLADMYGLGFRKAQLSPAHGHGKLTNVSLYYL